MDKNKKIISITAVVLGAVILTILFVLILSGGKASSKKGGAKKENNKIVEKEKNTKTQKSSDNEDNNEKDNDSKKGSTEKKNKSNKKDNKYEYKLTNQTEEFKVDDKLTIKFVGTKEEYGENMYTYNASIYLNGKIIENQIFNNVNNRVIYSENHAAEFYVEKIDNVYIIVSYVAKQYDGNFVAIINSKGEVLNEFNDVSININNKEVTISVHLGSVDNEVNTTFDVNGEEFNLRFEKDEEV